LKEKEYLIICSEKKCSVQKRVLKSEKIKAENVKFVFKIPQQISPKYIDIRGY